MIDLGIKSTIKEWLNNWIKQPIERKTQELESFIGQQVNKAQNIANTHRQKAQDLAYKPVNQYQKQPTFYRGLFWIAIGLLVVLWIISGK